MKPPFVLSNPSTVSTKSILERLKVETRPQHDAIERRVDLKHHLQNRENYAALLSRFFGFYVPLEMYLVRIIDYGTVGLEIQPRLKAHLIRRDLQVLHVETEQLKTCSHLPEVRTLGDALGCLYVLEGATLGGQFIRREVERELGMKMASGCAFFFELRG